MMMMMKMKMKLHLVLLLLFLASGTLSVSCFTSDSIEVYTDDHTEPLSFGYFEMKTSLNCSYMVLIFSSCSSPKFTMENIAIRFGDASGNQVHGPTVAVPCLTDHLQWSAEIFEINGVCPSPICYLQLYTHGASDGYWKLETLQIFGRNTQPLTFKFKNFSPPPRGRWFGYNVCHLFTTFNLAGILFEA